MREIRLYGSEGGGTQANGFSLPLFSSQGCKPLEDVSICLRVIAPEGLQKILM